LQRKPEVREGSRRSFGAPGACLDRGAGVRAFLCLNKRNDVPVELLKAEPAGVAVVDFVDGILENLPRFFRVLRGWVVRRGGR